MITVIEKDGSYIAVFSEMSQKEQELFNQVRELSGYKTTKKNGVTFNFGAAATKKNDSNDYYSTASKSLSQTDTLKSSDRSLPVER